LSRVKDCTKCKYVNYFSTQHSNDKFTGITIGVEWSGGEDNPLDLSCSWCNRSLVKLIDRSGQNPAYYFNNCQVSREPEETRKKSKLSIQRKEIEPAITSIGNVPDVSLRKQIELKDGALALSKKGTIRCTHYEDSSQ
jgi:hypothetical protein